MCAADEVAGASGARCWGACEKRGPAGVGATGESFGAATGLACGLEDRRGVGEGLWFTLVSVRRFSGRSRPVREAPEGSWRRLGLPERYSRHDRGDGKLEERHANLSRHEVRQLRKCTTPHRRRFGRNAGGSYGASFMDVRHGPAS